MIAEVYVIKRLPRKFKVFDYKVPDDLNLTRGNIVRVSFRNTDTLGVVRAVKDKPPRGIRLKKITRLEHTYTLKEEELSFFEWLARDLAQSVGSILHATLPHPPKRPGAIQHLIPRTLTVPGSEAAYVANCAREIGRRRHGFIIAGDTRRAAAMIARFRDANPEQKCIVIAPTVTEALDLSSYLPNVDGLITGQETNNVRFDTWQNFRRLSRGCLVGTKSALLLCDTAISTIILVRSQHRSHKQFDRNPRVDARVLARELSNRFQTNLYFFDVSPSADDVAHFGRLNVIGRPCATQVEVVDREKERTGSPHPIIGYTVWSAIQNALDQGRDIWCVYNKKGAATRLSCKDCSQKFLCETCQSPFRVSKHRIVCVRCKHTEPLPLNCPTCKGANILQQGYGNEVVADAMRKLFNVEVDILDAEHTEKTGAPIVLTTQFGFEQERSFHPSSAGLVVLLDADAPLFDPSFRALDRAIHQLEQWRGFAHARGARFLMQTSSPELFTDILARPIEAPEQELELRRSLGQPPFRRWMSVRHAQEEPRKAELEAEILVKKIESLGVDVLLQTRHQIDPTTWEQYLSVGVDAVDPLLNLFTSMSDNYIIDTHAFSC